MESANYNKCCRLTRQVIDGKPCFFCSKPTGDPSTLTFAQQLSLLSGPVTVPIDIDECPACLEFTTDCTQGPVVKEPVKEPVTKPKEPSGKTQERSLATKAKTYTKALTGWAASGFRVRTDEEVTAIYNTHCEPCNLNGSCPLCGCKVNTSKIALWNKIKMGSQHCPKGKW